MLLSRIRSVWSYGEYIDKKLLQIDMKLVTMTNFNFWRSCIYMEWLIVKRKLFVSLRIYQIVWFGFLRQWLTVNLCCSSASRNEILVIIFVQCITVNVIHTSYLNDTTYSCVDTYIIYLINFKCIHSSLMILFKVLFTAKIGTVISN